MTTKQEKILSALQSPSYWKPNLSLISRDFNIPLSTVYSTYNTLIKRGIKMNAKLTPTLSLNINSVDLKFELTKEAKQ